MRDGKPNGFHFLDHRTTDAKYNIITDTFITAGNVADAKELHGYRYALVFKG
ncbi:transposase [Bacillus sp. IT-79MI2]|nr:hypothetical protein BTH41_01373 [Bacillus mycoides]